MTKTLCYALAATVLAGPWTAAGAADSPAGLQPVAVISLSGYNDVKADVGCLGKISGNPDLADGLESLLSLMTQNRGLEGLDKDRPWGIVFEVDPEKLAEGGRKLQRVVTPWAFVPVTDADALVGVLSQFLGEPEDVGDGLLKVQKKGKPVYLKKTGDWLFFAEREESLEAVPEQPQELLGGLDRQYDLAVRFQPENVPAEIRQEGLAALKKKAAADLRKKEHESDEEFAVRQLIARRLGQVILRLAEDLDQVTLGWGLDREKGQSHLDLTVTARAGTETALRLADFDHRTSDFHGFLLSEAALSGNWSCVFHPLEESKLEAVFALARQKAAEEIDRTEDSQEKREAVKRLSSGLLDVIQQTLGEGRLDGGMAVRLDPDAVTIAAGGFVPSGDSVEQTLSDAADAARDESPAFVDRALSTYVAEVKDIRFHQVSLPIPENVKGRPQLVRMFGETLDVLVGIGPQSFYVSAGKEARALVEEVIQRSQQESSQAAAPAELCVSAGALAGFVAEMGKPNERAPAERIARLLEPSAGNDHVKLTASPVQRGVQIRLDLEEGILKAIGAAASKKSLRVVGTRTSALDEHAGL